MSDTTFTPTHEIAVCAAETPGDWLLGFWEDGHVVEHTSGDPNQSIVHFVDSKTLHLESLPIKFIRKIPPPTWTENLTSDGTIQYHVPDDWFCPLCFSFQIEDRLLLHKNLKELTTATCMDYLPSIFRIPCQYVFHAAKLLCVRVV